MTKNKQQFLTLTSYVSPAAPSQPANTVRAITQEVDFRLITRQIIDQTLTETNVDFAILRDEIRGKVSRTDFDELGRAVESVSSSLSITADRILMESERINHITGQINEAFLLISPEAINATVRQQIMDEVGNLAETTQSSLEILAGGITASSERIDHLTGRVNAAELQITPDAINATVREQIRDEVGNLREETESSIKVVSDGITATSTRVDHLTGRVDSAELLITPDAINATVRQQIRDEVGELRSTVESSLSVLADGITAESTRIDLLTGDLEEAKLSITPSAINATVRKQITDAVGELSSSVETSLSVLADGIGATSTRLDEVSGRVEAAELLITPNAINATVRNQITDAVSGLRKETETSLDVLSDGIAAQSTRVDELTGEFDTAMLELTPDKITQTVSSRMFIGTRNLMFNTSNFKNTTNWISNGGGISLGELDYNGTNVLVTAFPSGAYYSLPLVLTGDTEYVISMMISTSVATPGANNMPIHLLGGRTPGASNDLITFISQDQSTIGGAGNWKRVWIIFKTKLTKTEKVYVRPFVHYAGRSGWVRFTEIKLEQGNKMTDYSPAPEDINAQFTETISSIKVVSDGITAQSTRIDNLNGKVEDALLELTPAKINLAVSSQIDTKINSINVGTRNYILKSGGIKEVANSTTVENYIIYNISQQLEPNTEYTLSCMMKMTANVKDADMYYISVSEHHRTKVIQNTNSNTWTHQTFTFKTGAAVSANDFIRFDNNGTTGGAATLSINNAKLEKGNKATDWSPAPEDVQTEITTINQSLLELTPTKINLMVSSQISSKVVDYDYKGRNLLIFGVTWAQGFIGADTNSGTDYIRNVNWISLPEGTTQVTYTIYGDDSIYTADLVEYRSASLGGYIRSQNMPGVGAYLTRTYTLDAQTKFLRFQFYRQGGVTPAYAKLGLKVKLEVGNVASDYTAAPEDIDKQITQINTSLLELTPDKIGLLVSSQINNIQIGTRNLLRNSNFAAGGNIWSVNGGQIDYQPTQKRAWLIMTILGQGIYQGGVPSVAGRTYTISFETMATFQNGTLAKIGFDSGNTGTINGAPSASKLINIPTSSTEWIKTVVTVVCPSNNNPVVFYNWSNNQNNFYIRNLKMEEGQFATAWSPNPDDVDGQISTINTALLDLTPTKITQRVSEEVSKVQIGGNNLLIFSRAWLQGNIGIGTDSGSPYIRNPNYIFVGNTKQLTYTRYGDGTIYTADIVEYRLLDNITAASFIRRQSMPGGDNYSSVVLDLHPETKWIRFVFYRGAGVNPSYATTGLKVKLEAGNKATDWTPAIEDTDSLISNDLIPFRYIRDHLNGSTSNAGNHWVQIQAFNTSGVNVALGKPVITNGTVIGGSLSWITDGNTTDTQRYVNISEGSQPYVQIDLGAIYKDIEIINVRHYWHDGRRYNTRLQVSTDGINWVDLYNSLDKNNPVQATYAETASGMSHTTKSSYNVSSLYNRLTSAEIKITPDAIVSTVSSGLRVAGRNLLKNTRNFQNLANWIGNGVAISIGSGNYIDGSNVIIGRFPSGMYYNIPVPIKGGTEYTYSAMIRTENTQAGSPTVPLHIWVGSSPNTNGSFVSSYVKWDQNTTPNTWKRIYMTFRTAGNTNNIYYLRPYIYTGSTTGDFWITEIMVAEGNVVTDWSPSPEEFSAEIDKVYTQITQTSSSISLTVNNQSDAATTGMGELVSRNPLFLDALVPTTGWSIHNNLWVYDNGGTGSISITRETNVGTQPTGIHRLAIRHNGGSTNPGWGGVRWGFAVRQNAVFHIRLIAHVPVGRFLNLTENAIGNGAVKRWLKGAPPEGGDVNRGTGTWTEYIFRYECGSTGSFADAGYIFLTGGAAPTSAAPLLWYLGFAGFYDMSRTEQTPTRAEVESAFTMDSNGIKMFGKNISLNGMVTFTNLNNDAQARINTAHNTATAANTAAGNAQGTADTANNTANGAQGRINAWTFSGTTQINGGEIRTNTITATQIAAGTITATELAANAITADKIAAGAITAGKIAAGSITGDRIAAGTVIANSIEATNLRITGSSSLGGFNISGNTLINRESNTALLFNNLSSTNETWLKINEGNNAPVIGLRTDQQSRIGIAISTYAVGAQGLNILSQTFTGDSSSRAIYSVGSHEFIVRGGEMWNAPGVLLAQRLNVIGYNSYTNLGHWTSRGITSNHTSVGNYVFRLLHNIGHTDYVPIISHVFTNGGGAGSIQVTEMTATTMTWQCWQHGLVNIVLMGRNRIV